MEKMPTGIKQSTFKKNYCLAKCIVCKIQRSDEINSLNLEKIKRYNKSNRFNFEKFIATIKGTELVFKSLSLR
jgi:hypothetical protein